MSYGYTELFTRLQWALPHSNFSTLHYAIFQIEMEHKAYWAVKQCNMSLTIADEKRLLDLEELEELRLKLMRNLEFIKRKRNVCLKCLHDNNLLRKNLQVGQKVPLFNSTIEHMSGKLKSKWIDPFVITNISPFDVVNIKSFDIRKIFKVNGHRLKVYNEGEVDPTCSTLTLTLPSYT